MAGGRPSKFKPEFVAQAGKLCELGATDAELATFFEVAVSTIEKWRKDHPEFSVTIKDAKDKADDRVERRLFERAMGYEHDETDIRVIGQELVMTPIRKVYPPDTTAAIFWLKNRRSATWRDIKAVELGNMDGKAFSIVASGADEAL